jgi:hypothetical protein
MSTSVAETRDRLAHESRWAECRCAVNDESLKLAGNITDISRGGLYEDHQDRVTLYVEGAEPLYAELRLPNRPGWTVGQRVVLVIVPTPSGAGMDART